MIEATAQTEETVVPPYQGDASTVEDTLRWVREARLEAEARVMRLREELSREELKRFIIRAWVIAQRPMG